MSTFTPTRNPRGGGHYDAEEDMPYNKGAGSDGVSPSGGSGGGFRPGGAGRTSSRDAKPGSRHRKLSDEDLAAAEAAAGAGDVSKDLGGGAIASEKSALDEAIDDGFYNDDSGKGGIRNWSRRKKATAGVGAALGAGTIGLLMMAVGPFQYLQLAQNLQEFHFGNNESMMDGRASRLVYYGKDSRERGNLGFFGNQVADTYEAKLRKAGFEPDYKNPYTGRSARSIQAFRIDPSTPEGQQALARLRADGVDIPNVGPDGKITISLRGRGSEVLGRKVIRASLSSIGISKVSSWIGGRLLITRADTRFTWLKKFVTEGGEETIDGWRRRNVELDAEIRNGSVAVDSPRRPVDAPDIGDDGDGIVVAGDVDATAGNLSDAINGGLGVIGLVALICTIDQFGNSVASIQQSNIVLPLIRTGTFAISTGSQIMANDGFNMEELGAFSMRLFDPETGLGWSAAKSIQAEWGVENPSGPDMPDSAKPGKEKPLFFEQLSDAIDAAGLRAVCDFLTSPAGSTTVDIADGILAAVSGGWDLLLEALGYIAGVAAQPLIEDLARWLAGEPLQEFAQGALFGNYANYGARLMANDTAVSTGGVELTGTETAILDADRLEMKNSEFQHKDLFARLFSPYETRSLVAKTVLQNPNLSSPQAATSQFAKLPTTVFSQIGSSFANVFSPKLKAINTSGYDYGFPEYGYALDLQDDPRFNDPYENGEIVEALGLDSGANLNETYGVPCFGTTVSDGGTLTTLDSRPMGEIPDICKENSEQLLRYRFYIADTIAMKSLTCLENIDEAACSELGFSSGSTAGGGGDGSLPDGDGPQLAQMIIDNPNIGNDYSDQLQNIVDTGKPCPDINPDFTIDPELLRVIAALGENNSFTISSLHRGCTGSTVGAGDGSLHWQGKAADISGSRPINGATQGASYSTHNATIQAFVNEAASLLPAVCELGLPNDTYISQVSATSPRCTNAFIDRGTAPHFHLGVGD
jgi:hypothetical protein